MIPHAAWWFASTAVCAVVASAGWVVASVRAVRLRRRHEALRSDHDLLNTWADWAERMLGVADDEHVDPVFEPAPEDVTVLHGRLTDVVETTGPITIVSTPSTGPQPAADPATRIAHIPAAAKVSPSTKPLYAADLIARYKREHS